MINVNDIRDNILSVPVWGAYLKHLEPNLNEMIEYVYDLKKNYPSHNRSNVNGHQTADDLHTIPVFKPLVDWLNLASNEIVEQFDKRHKYKVQVTSMWCNINQKGSLNYAHVHSGDISGVFYLKVPYNSGNLVFVNPAQRSEAHRIRIENKAVNSEVLACLLFPSWLEHYVQPNQSDEDRISISFNISEVR